MIYHITLRMMSFKAAGKKELCTTTFPSNCNSRSLVWRRYTDIRRIFCTNLRLETYFHHVQKKSYFSGGSIG
jgi:hypothetical protein